VKGLQVETISPNEVAALPAESRPERPPFFGRRLVRFASLAVLVALLEVIVLRSYLLGRNIPPWDFLGSYNTDAYLWWSQGSFFAPVDWIPNVWAGYPAALNLQNSAWFLPVGISNLISPFTLQSAAVLAAVYVALGFFGTYLLLRSLRVDFPLALVGSTAAFFGVGYFSNAQHVDISRAYALIPFVLLVLSPSWNWRKWWGLPLGAFILWQAATGIYPGMIVTTAYVGVVWVITHQLITRAKPRAYIVPLAIAATSAVLLSMPRLLPYFLLSGDSAAGLPEASAFSPSMVGTLLYGYSSGELPNDISMRSFFIPATMLLLAFFARWSDPATRAGVALGAPALLLGMPFWPWFQAAQSLPGLSLSRFTMSDFKPFLVLAVILLASSGLTHIVGLRKSSGLPTRRIVIPTIGAGLFVVLLGVVGVVGPFLPNEWRPEFVVLGIVYAVIVAYILWGTRRVVGRVLLVASLLVVTAISGSVWAYTTQAPWNAIRVPAEGATYGETVDDLLAHRVDQTGLEQRPARLPLEDGYDDVDIYSVGWNRVFYTNESAVGGYLNLKGSETQAQLLQALTEPATRRGMAEFLAAPGLVYSLDDAAAPSSQSLLFCLSTSDCGPVAAVPAGYAPGRISYDVTTDTGRTVILNEAYYDGWHATACDSDGACSDLTPVRSSLGVVQIDLPAGDYVLELEYRTPGRAISWVLFALGAFTALLPVAVAVVTRQSARRKVSTS
jgi:hypothetical protein